MARLLLTENDLEWLRQGLDHRVYFDPTDDGIVLGTSAHCGPCTVVLSPDDAEQASYDLDVCSGIVAERLCSIRDGDDDWSDPDGNELEPA